ncbi:MAG: ABC transporter substrate-binding protein [Syntrophomonadaceae bacterium]
MSKVLIQLPLNISRALDDMLKEFGREMEIKHGLPVEIVSELHCQAVDAGPIEIQPGQAIDAAGRPDLIIGHVDYFTRLPGRLWEQDLRALPGRFPLRPELAQAGFADPEGYFHPFVVMPLAIFYNPDLLPADGLPGSWEDLLEPCWQGKICMPDRHHLAPKMIRAHIQAHYPDQYHSFQANLVHLGAPINVIQAVDQGQYPLGVTNMAFARIARGKNIRLLWPRDGMLCIPLVMAWGRDADDRLLEFGDFMLSRPVQEYIALQTFVPVSPAVAIPQFLAEHDFSLRWQGWDDYLETIGGLTD